VQPNLVSLTGQLEQNGQASEAIVRELRLFNAYAPEFRHESDRLARALKEEP
jgi:hypothetical protein